MKAQSLGAAVRLYRLICPDEVAWHRIERRNAALDGSSLFIARKTFEALRAKFEPLEPDEEREEIASLE
jgi:predicted kinase